MSSGFPHIYAELNNAEVRRGGLEGEDIMAVIDMRHEESAHGRGSCFSHQIKGQPLLAQVLYFEVFSVL